MQGPTFLELTRQALQNVEGGYNLLAPKFDASPYITPDLILETFFEKVQEEIPSIKTGLDLCAGTGAASVFLAPLCRERFTALDLSKPMLDLCEAKIKELDLDITTEFIKGDALGLPFKEEFDLVVSFGAFGHILSKDESKFLGQIHKALKPGGHFLFITTGKLPLWSFSLWYQRLFNLALRIRNFLIRPKFIMYYLTFRLPAIQRKLEATGFEVEVLEEVDFAANTPDFRYFIPLSRYKMVKAKKITLPHFFPESPPSDPSLKSDN